MSESGVFNLWVKPTDRQPWGLLEKFGFDNSKRKKAERRDAVKDAALSCLVGWATNYVQYRDSAFCIEEQESEYAKPVHIVGTPRDRKKGGGLKRLKL